ncbi:DNA methyltransferase Dim-2 [Curvularia kusanoi]|uniref:DNA (cytosine-5-)-methyltransferase n=1 Tax=Curvularia kusanoi TaxID=90978 RepID=A0A9P4TPG3_CURKU|nr:DNA methyltransferase Dim-2 [Curvularia kusanoi]
MGIEVRVPPPDHPRSSAVNYVPPGPITSETEILQLLDDAIDTASETSNTRIQREDIIADLEGFEIYRCPLSERKRGSELIGLNFFDVRARNLRFDGYILVDNTRHYVERLKVENISIGGYGADDHPNIVAYIQTPSKIWLRLGQPASRYMRYHVPFIWAATLGKHAIDYMEDQPAGAVSLEDFTTIFNSWLAQRFGSNKHLQRWFALFGNKTDFRVAFHAYKGFIYKQALNMSTSQHLMSHPIWSHCMCNSLVAIKRRSTQVSYTITTAHVYQCFKEMYFSTRLKRKPLSTAVNQSRRQRALKLGFAEDHALTTAIRLKRNDNMDTSNIRIGDVVSVVPDDTDKRHWQKSSDVWYAFVQGIVSTTSGAKRLMILWLYRPEDTNICLAKYPVTRELFLSDNCNCREGVLLTTDVTRTYMVEWAPKSLNTTKDFLIRQTYMTNDSAFVTYKYEHRVCSCRTPKPNLLKWRAGDTVYITKMTAGMKVLEPAVIQEIDEDSRTARVRTLLRLRRDLLHLAADAGRTRILPNELVLTGKLKTISLTHIQRSCYVRFVPKADILNNIIPAPYDQGGAGDFGFITMGLDSTIANGRLIFLESLPRGFHETREHQLPYKKLRGLSLFSGGGGLDRGLEQAGAVEFDTSVDYDPAAIHTQRANCKDPRRMRLFCGSVDDYLKILISGNKDHSVARIGEIDLIASGSPCPGFSALQQNMLSEQSIIYASHITTFCTAVDVYRPLYGILENVVNMASTRTGLEEQNILSQLVACLVSMGYQVNQYIMDSWNYGSCQRRSRIILTIAAPGLEPIRQQPHTHSRRFEETKARSLGKLPNGERFGDREHYPTPFPHVCAHEATSDLPSIGNGNVQTCIEYPDHRLSRLTNNKGRKLLECIPTYPPGYGYAEAIGLNLIPPLLRMTKKETGKAYRRIEANKLIPTITTDVCMQDARNGASVHWSQHRPLSIQEARRTQGYPDEEPIIGTLSEQWKIIGNGVDRKVSFSIGLALRNAFAKCQRASSSKRALEEEIEVIVDAEDDAELDLFQGANTIRDGSISSPASSSTDSFSNMRQAHEFLPQPPQAANKSSFPLLSPGYLPPQTTNAQTDIKAPGLFMAQLPQRPTADVRRLSLPTISASVQSDQRMTTMKRPRDQDASESSEASKDVAEIPLGVKKARVVQERRTVFPEMSSVREQTREKLRCTSVPPVDSSMRTRRSGPAEFAPKAWNKKIGSSENVVQLA